MQRPTAKYDVQVFATDSVLLCVIGLRVVQKQLLIAILDLKLVDIFWYINSIAMRCVDSQIVLIGSCFYLNTTNYNYIENDNINKNKRNTFDYYG